MAKISSWIARRVFVLTTLEDFGETCIFLYFFGGGGEELAVISCLTPGGPAQRCGITVRPGWGLAESVRDGVESGRMGWQ